MTDKERAAWRAMQKVIESGRMNIDPVEKRFIDAVEELLEDDVGCSPRVDRSLRGWVIVHQKSDKTRILWATEDGIFDYFNATGQGLGTWTSWDRAERYGWTVRKLAPENLGYKVRQWDEWTDEERREYKTACSTSWLPTHADKAIEIATREVPHEHERV